jgi:hypothetical protein
LFHRANDAKTLKRHFRQTECHSRLRRVSDGQLSLPSTCRHCANSPPTRCPHCPRVIHRRRVRRHISLNGQGALLRNSRQNPAPESAEGVRIPSPEHRFFTGFYRLDEAAPPRDGGSGPGRFCTLVRS